MNRFEALLAQLEVDGWAFLTAGNLGDMSTEEFHQFMDSLIARGGPKGFNIFDVERLSDGTGRITRAKIERLA